MILWRNEKSIGRLYIGRRLRLRDLHVFSTVVQCGSMAKAAAAALESTQPTVSEVIADLEHMFGVRLLDRSAQGIAPTMYGDALLKRSVAAFDELKQSRRDIEFLADPTVGEKLHIGCVEDPFGDARPARSSEALRAVSARGLTPGRLDGSRSRAAGAAQSKYDLIMVRPAAPLTDQHLAEYMNVECIFNDQLVVAVGKHNRWARRRKIDIARADR